VGVALSLLSGEGLTGVRGLSLLADDVEVGIESSAIVVVACAEYER
jgi:hypothetical protein